MKNIKESQTEEKKKRKSIRLPAYDYSLFGAYFITICVKDMKCILGDVIEKEMNLNRFGKVADSMWSEIANCYDNVDLDEFIIMPNHMHGIIIIGPFHEKESSSTGFVGAIQESPAMTILQRRRMLLSKIVGRYKMRSAKKINQERKTPGISVWQRSFYKHIIRNDDDLFNIRDYIVKNPINWSKEKMGDS